MSKVVRLGDIARAVGGNGFPKKYQSQSEKEFPFFKVSDMNTLGNEIKMKHANNYVDDFDLKEIKAKLHPPGTIIFPKIGGAIATNKKRILISYGAFDNNVMGVIPKNGLILPEFLYNFFLSLDLYEISNKASLPSITKGAVEDLKISLPSLEEQEKILGKLNYSFSNIDKQIETTYLKIKNIKRLLSKKTLDDFKFFKETFNMISIKKVCKNIFAGGDAPKNNYSKMKNEKYNIPIFSNGVKNKGLYGFTDFSKVDEPALTISGRGTIGYTEIRNEPFVPIVRLIVLIPDINLISIDYLKEAILNLNILNGGSSIPQLTVPMIKSYGIPLPPIDIQEKYIENISEIEKRISIISKKSHEKINQLYSLKKIILLKEFCL